jgi:hypothetical protein
MNRSLNRGNCRALAIGIIGAFFLIAFPISGESSLRVVSENHDLTGEIKRFADYRRDFESAQTKMSGEEWRATDFLNSVSRLDYERLDALQTTLEVYDRISCKTDREQVKALVRNQLTSNAKRIEQQSDDVAKMLAQVKTTSVSLAGFKMKYEIRTAKERLDSIAASLD